MRLSPLVFPSVWADSSERRGVTSLSIIFGVLLLSGVSCKDDPTAVKSQHSAPVISDVHARYVATSVISATIAFDCTVTTANEKTICYVEYGQTSAYGLRTPIDTSGASGSSWVFEDTILVSPGSVYHWRFFTQNAFGATTSGDSVFSAVVLHPPLGLSPKQVMLTGIVQVRQTAYLEYGNSTLYGQTAPMNVESYGHVSATIRGLNPGTLYYWRIGVYFGTVSVNSSFVLPR